jgi:phytoene dehydrogenase-like protein
MDHKVARTDVVVDGSGIVELTVACYLAQAGLQATVFEKVPILLKHPVHYIDGGWRVLVDGLRAVAERAGARIVSGARVEAVEVSRARARSVRLPDGSLVRTTAVVVATGPQGRREAGGRGRLCCVARCGRQLYPSSGGLPGNRPQPSALT